MNDLANLNNETDRMLRNWALRIDTTHGEDGYHNAVCQLLNTTEPIRNLIGLLKVKTRSAIFKLYQHERIEYRNLEALYVGCKSSMDNLRPPSTQESCKRGHQFSDENVYTYKGKRTCKLCRQMREKWQMREKHST